MNQIKHGVFLDISHHMETGVLNLFIKSALFIANAFMFPENTWFWAGNHPSKIYFSYFVNLWWSLQKVWSHLFSK